MPKFDVVIGNPPYTEGRKNDNSTRAKPLYDKFVKIGLEHSDICAMIIPMSWMTLHTFSSFKNYLLNKNNIRILNYENKTNDCFKNIKVNSGICYFMVDNRFKNEDLYLKSNTEDGIYFKNKYDIITTKKIVINIFDKIFKKTNMFLKDIYVNDAKIKSNEFKKLSKNYFNESKKIIASLFYDDIRYIKDNNFKNINKYKCAISMVSRSKFKYARILDKNIITTQSIAYFPFDTKTEALNCLNYLNTKIVSFLMSFSEVYRDGNSIQYNGPIFRHVPKIDLTRTWTDEELYAHFNLTEEEIKYIEETVK